jgi:uncharacterized protein (TIGR00255 family)
VRERLERGAVTVAVTVTAGGGAAALDADRARAAGRALVALASELGLAPPTIGDVLGMPGVIADGVATASALGPGGEAVTIALAALCLHRDTEGEALAADLRARTATMRGLVDEIAVAAAAAAPEVAARLRDRLDRALAPGAVAADRLAQEVAIAVDRADVTEELVRARAHTDAIVATLDGGGPAGRRLDFLLQELGREINTTGSKSATAAISALVVQAKAELEKMREQVQNLE